MQKGNIGLVIIIAILVVAVVVAAYYFMTREQTSDTTQNPTEENEEETCTNENTNVSMGIGEALDIALNSECGRQGEILDTRICNANSGTWWIDLDILKLNCRLLTQIINQVHIY